MEIEEYKQQRIDEVKKRVREPKVSVTTSLIYKDWNDAQDNGIKWNDALSFGIAFLLADRDGVDYPDCNLKRQLEKVVKQRNEALIELQNLKEPVTEEEIKEEADSFFGGLTNAD